MKKLLLFLAAIFLFVINAFAKTTPELPKGFKQQNTGISFTENKGQVHDQNYNPRPDVLYGTMTGNMAVHIKNSGVSYQLYRVDKYKEVEDFKAPFSNGEGRGDEASQQTIYRIDLNWLNSNTNFTTTEDETLPGYNNYYLENCPNGALNVKSYKGITLNNLYNGINLHYYEKNGELKHDYIVAAHADYKQIQVQIEGADISINKDGSLLLITPLGKIQEGAPIVYQNSKQLKAKWLIRDTELGRSVSFEIENYNPNFELIIDPITRLWATYYGGTGDDVGQACTTDASGNVYMSGWTTSTGIIIATSGSHQSTFGGNSDAFLIKFNTDGVRQWATYYGGASGELGNSCATDISGNVYLAGGTSSNTGTVIATSGSHQLTYGGVSDAFLVKFDGNGIRQWGTYYGGTGNDLAYSCTTDASGNVYMVGFTRSNTSTIIATSGSHQSAYGGGTGSDGDAFLVKFNSNGVRQWGTYYGGSTNDYGYSCATDVSNNVYLAGSTDFSVSTSTIIATVGSHQSVYGGSNGDAFLAKFDANGIRQWATYYGGSGGEDALSCITDVTGNVYIAGETSSNTGTVIASAGSHQSSHGGGIGDAFLVKFDANGIRQWGTYYGGVGIDYGYSCALDAVGNIYISGYASSNTGTVIATNGSYQPAFGGGSYDSFLAIFDASGIRQWGTYYGGASNDYGYSCAVDAGGNMYLAGYTTSNTGAAIATVDSHQSAYGGGGGDAFLVKFRDCDILSPVAAGTASVCSGASISLSASISDTVTPNYTWAGPNSFTAAVQNPSISNASTVNVGVYTVTTNNIGCKETATTIVASADPTVTVNSGSICIGSNFVIVPNGASTYTITGNNFTVSPNTQTSYSVTGTSASGCVSGNTAVATVTVNALPTVSVNSGSICAGSHFVITPSGANTYTVTGNNFTVSPNTQTSYSVIGKSAQGCLSSNTAVATVTVKATPSITISVSSNTICVNETGTLSASGADTYTWSTNENSTNISVSPSHTTTYSVTGTNTNACTSATSATLFVDECTGIEETDNNLSLLKIYPNPNNGVFTVEMQENTSIVVINSLGQIVYASQLSSGKQQINLEGLAQGIYVVKVGNAKSSKCVKVVKE